MTNTHFTGHGMLDFRCDFAKQKRAEMDADGSFESEDFGFAQELVMQYGGDLIDDDGTIFQISAKDLYVIMRVLGYSSNHGEEKKT